VKKENIKVELMESEKQETIHEKLEVDLQQSENSHDENTAKPESDIFENIHRFISPLNGKKWVEEMVKQLGVTLVCREESIKKSPLYSCEVTIQEYNISVKEFQNKQKKANTRSFRHMAILLAFHLNILSSQFINILSQEERQRIIRAYLDSLPRPQNAQQMNLSTNVNSELSKEEIEKWREERRKNFPTSEKVAQKEAVTAKAQARAEDNHTEKIKKVDTVSTAVSVSLKQQESAKKELKLKKKLAKQKKSLAEIEKSQNYQHPQNYQEPDNNQPSDNYQTQQHHYQQPQNSQQQPQSFQQHQNCQQVNNYPLQYSHSNSSNLIYLT